MKLYLMRHGDAVQPSVNPDRPLSERGLQQVHNLANLLAERRVNIASIYHSGITRAEQTATIIGDALKPGKVEMRTGLTPNDPVDSMAILADTFTDAVMLVGHMPFMGRMAAQLLLGDSRRTVVIFETSTTACFTPIGDSRWALEWVLSPTITG